MKIIKRIFLVAFGLCLVFCAFAFSSELIESKAWFSPDEVEVIGAGVRTEGDKTGIRFVGKRIESSPKASRRNSSAVKTYGFIIAYGKTDTELTIDTNSINGKNVLVVEVDELDENGYFYATIFNIPETKYIQDITVRAFCYYVNYSYSENQVTRNLAYLTNKALNDDCTGTILTNVKNYMADNYKVLDSDSVGNTYMLAPTYEYNVNRLFVEFMNDINEFTNSKTFEIDNCKSSLENFKQAFLASCVDTTSPVLKSFLSNVDYADKWSWLFNGLYSVDYLSNNTKYQLDYVLSKINYSSGFDNATWNNGLDLSIFLYDFFTQSSIYEGKVGKDFGKQKIFYSNIIRSNNKIYSTLDTYEFTEDGSFPTLVNINIKNAYLLPETNQNPNYTNKYVVLGDEIDTLVDSGSTMSSDRNIVCSRFTTTASNTVMPVNHTTYGYTFNFATIEECLSNVCEGDSIKCMDGEFNLPASLDINNITISGNGLDKTVLLGNMQLEQYYTGLTLENLTLECHITNTLIENSSTVFKANVSNITFNNCKFYYDNASPQITSFINFVDGDEYYTENIVLNNCNLSASASDTTKLKYLDITNCYNISIINTNTSSSGNGNSIYIRSSIDGIGFTGTMKIDNCIFDNYDTIFVQRYYHSITRPLYVLIEDTGNKYTGHPFLTFAGLYCQDVFDEGGIPNENNFIFTNNFRTNPVSGGSNVLELNDLFHAVDFDFNGDVNYNGVKTQMLAPC